MASEGHSQATGTGASHCVLDQVIADYLCAEESGKPLDRDGLLQQHPDLATQLQEFFDQRDQLAPALEALNRLSQSSPGSLPGSPQTDSQGQLGDYQIVREIGRGGMGVVYEARQLSLRRRVALKVLPLAAVLDSRQLERFKNEAQAAALLHHHNIVPVYGIGCERGVHYYAMQYIDGQSLAHVIQDLRAIEGVVDDLGPENKSRIYSDATHSNKYTSSTGASDAKRHVHSELAPVSSGRSSKSIDYVRSIAELGAEVAEALDYAHSKGVIHRDIKPSNLLLDAQGKAWISDFGLARIDSDHSLTLTGDLVGTLRYMSPEQALGGKRAVLDHRTDIYSLGATLYELLTLRPMHTQRDRHGLVHGITVQEPRSLRSFNRSVPHDLNTIIFKAIEKDPQRRYPTAKAMSDDLRRFLADKPIHAKPPTLWQRSAKWTRRHKPLTVTLAGCAAVLLVTVTVLMSINSVRLRRAHGAALAEAGKTTATLRLLQDMLASASPDEGAGRNYTVRQLLDDFADELAARLSGQTEVEAAVRTTIGRTYAKLGASDQAETHLQRALELKRASGAGQTIEAVKILNDLASVAYFHRRQRDVAEILARQAMNIHQQAKAENVELVHTLRLLARTSLERDHETSLNYLQQAGEVCQRLAGRETVLARAQVNYELANALLSQRRCVDALPPAIEAVEIRRRHQRKEHPHFIAALRKLSQCLKQLRVRGDAEHLYARGLSFLMTTIAEVGSPIGNSVYTHHLVLFYLDNHQYESAEQHCRRVLKELPDPIGSELAYHDEVFHAFLARFLLAGILETQQNHELAREQFRLLLPQARQFAQTHPDRIDTQMFCARVLRSAAEDPATALNEAKPLALKAVELAEHQLGSVASSANETLARVHALEGDYRNAATTALRALELLPKEELFLRGRTEQAAANYLLACGRSGDAETLLRRALANREKALPENHPDLGAAKLNLASVLIDLKKPDEAQRLLAEANEFWKGQPRDHFLRRHARAEQHRLKETQKRREQSGLTPKE